jgi:NADP-dependent 3-hydroxy acid dehydrogenase YdfG
MSLLLRGMKDYFKEKVVLVTGGSSGIGKALVHEALQQGAYVATCGRSLGKLQDAFHSADKERLLLVATDVRDEAACTAFVQAALNRWGRVDVLINNAGITMRALFDDASLQVIRDLMDINFWGTVQCTKAALPAIKKAKGVIVGVSSIAGYRGLPARTGYSASKFAVQGFLEALRTELLHTGVHVMWVSPGFTASNIRNVALSANGTAQGETPLDEGGLMSAEECARRILQAVESRKRTVVMTGQGKLTVWLNKLLPALADKLVFNHFAKEPGSPLR